MDRQLADTVRSRAQAGSTWLAMMTDSGRVARFFEEVGGVSSGRAEAGA
ncbi:MAG: hypothetical protein KIS84_09515 [Dokdonella sp.]|nr:hypothetical protein [Dokdonella sp.]